MTIQNKTITDIFLGIQSELIFFEIFQYFPLIYTFFFCLMAPKIWLLLVKVNKYTIQEEIGKHFFDRAAQLLKEGKKFVFVLDNIDWDVKAHDMRSDHQNKSVQLLWQQV